MIRKPEYRRPAAGVVSRRRRRSLIGALLAATVVVAIAVVPGCASGRGAGSPAPRRGAVQIGKASYYAHALAGHRTASGERYDPKAFTAAHPRLPLGTWVRVTRPGGPSVDVRINDRCGCQSHIIDLSEAAARRLDMLRAGSVAVRLEVLR